MMRRTFKGAAAALAAVLVLAGCGSNADGGGGGGDGGGEPVHGGSISVLQIGEPRHFAPRSQTNNSGNSTIASNAVFGTLVEADGATGELNYNFAESLETEDEGQTLDLKIREGIEFSDGTPYNAEAVKFNWEHMAEPEGSAALRAQVAMIEEMEVVDDLTLRLHMVDPTPNFGFTIGETALTWIASPAALAEGDQAFDANPVGAGPFTLESWTRQDSMELVRNENYWDDPKPYLDAMTVRFQNQASQVHNALVSGGTDLASVSNDGYFKRAEDAGLGVEFQRMNGAQLFNFNTTRAPFDDIRARQAVVAAIDFDQINSATYDGAAELAGTLFTEDSPFYEDVPLAEFDRDRAQELLNEIAEEGEPLNFTITAVATDDARIPAESIQAQLNTLDNVNVEVDIIDFPQLSVRTGARDFDALVGGAMGVDPDYFLFRTYHSESAANPSGLNDPEVDEGLEAGRRGTTVEDRKAGYDIVQERLAELTPSIYYTRGSSGFAYQDYIHGARLYAYGSIQPDGIWTTQ